MWEFSGHFSSPWIWEHNPDPSWQGQAVEITPGKPLHFFINSAPSGTLFARVSAQKDPSPRQAFPSGSWPDPCYLPAVLASHLHPRLILSLPFPSAHKLSPLLKAFQAVSLLFSCKHPHSHGTASKQTLAFSLPVPAFPSFNLHL